MPAISVPYAIACMSDTCGITESNPPGQPQAEVTFTCLAADHYTLIQDLLGRPVAAGSAILRTYPFRYPPSPNLIATAIESVEFYGKWTTIPGVSLPWLWREKCKVRCRFELPQWFPTNVGDPSGQPYTTTSFQAQPEVLTLPNTSYTFPSSGQPTTVNVGLKFGKMAISYMRRMMPFVPVPQCFPLLGGVNNAAVTIAGFSCATGTLYYAGFSTSASADPQGNLYWDTEHAFEYRIRPWNQFLSPVPGAGWETVQDSGGNPVNTPVDFTQIP